MNILLYNYFLSRDMLDCCQLSAEDLSLFLAISIEDVVRILQANTVSFALLQIPDSEKEIVAELSRYPSVHFYIIGHDMQDNCAGDNIHRIAESEVEDQFNKLLQNKR